MDHQNYQVNRLRLLAGMKALCVDVINSPKPPSYYKEGGFGGKEADVYRQNVMKFACMCGTHSGTLLYFKSSSCAPKLKASNFYYAFQIRT